MDSEQYQYRPPKLGKSMLKVIYDAELVDEVIGDLDEIYQDRVMASGRFRANLHYYKDVFMSLRNYNLRSKRKTHSRFNDFQMIGNYIKSTFRTLSKNKTYSALNILGLAIGLAACAFILQYVSYENSYDKFHSQHQNIYRVRYQDFVNGECEIDCAAAVPRVGPFMKEVMPEVTEFTRAYPMTALIEKEGKQYREKRIHVTDPSFLKIFDYPLIHGDPETALVGPNKMVLTESTAKKYFGKTDVVGERLNFLTWFDTPMEVTGVTRDAPENSHLKYNMLVSYETINEQTTDDEDGKIYSESSWGWYDFNTYVLLKDGTDPAEFDKKFMVILQEELQAETEKSGRTKAFPLQPITDIHLYSDLLQESEPTEQGDGETVLFLSLIAVFILIIAWVNYVNLSTAKSMERAKEVGVRKSMGAQKRQLVFQFLVESFVLNLISLTLAIGMVAVFNPLFSQLVDAPISTSFLIQPDFWIAAVAVLLLGSLLAGLYPAFTLSSFKPMQVLKGRLLTSKSGVGLRRVLVTFQFAASVALIAGTIIVYQQLYHMNQSDLGFDMTDTMVLRGAHPNDESYGERLKNFKQDLTNSPRVKKVTSSSNIPGVEIFWTRGVRRSEDPTDQTYVLYQAGVDYEYFDAYEIDIIAGRGYDRQLRSDSASIIINEAGSNLFGFESPEKAIGKKLGAGSRDFTIIGVTDNYHQRSLKNTVVPIAFPLVDRSSDYITLKLASDDYQGTYDEVKTTFEDFFPGAPFEAFYLDEFYNRQYINEQNFSRTFTLFAIFAIMVACLGLFGLTSFSAIQRTKEIGIRKVLGAQISQIMFILSKEFLILLGIANVISWPLVYVMMNEWLNGFSSRISIGIPVFAASAVLVLIIAVIAVGYKTFTTAKSNPIRSLRYE